MASVNKAKPRKVASRARKVRKVASGADKARSAGVQVSPQLLELLVCPVTHALLRYNVETQELISDKASLAFPIRNGMPIMLVQQARNLK